MTFRIKEDRHFNNGGAIYTAPVIARKLNGYKVLNPEGNVAFLLYEDIEIIEISEAEKNMSIEL